MKTLLTVLAVLTMGSLASPQIQTADVIFINGDIYPGELENQDFRSSPEESRRLWTENPPQLKRFAAIAVAHGKIIAIGLSDEILRLKDKKTQVIDLGGHFVMPGFNDAHIHLASGGFEKLDIDLAGTKSLEEMKQRIATRAKTAGAGEWLVGRGWDHTLWSDQRLPNRQDIDAVTGDHPAIFNRVDGHIAIANSAALQAMGINAQSADPAGGKIDKDEKGEPTGILRETAMEKVLAGIPKPTQAQRRRAIELALQEAAAMGRHFSPGQFRLAGFPDLRATGERRQTHTTHFRVVAL